MDSLTLIKQIFIMAIRKGKSRINYSASRSYDETDRLGNIKEGKMRQPHNGNVVFETPIKQDDYNTDNDVYSEAIDKVEYNPDNHKLIIRFQRNNRLNPKEYVFHEVPLETALEFMDSPFPRKKKLPEKTHSLGATFRKVIRDAGFAFSKRWLRDEKAKEQQRPGNPDKKKTKK